MKHIPAILSCFTFLIFAACGGDKQQDPPPPATSPAGNATLTDIKSQVARANTSCSNSFAPAILSALTAQKSGAGNPALLALLGQANGGGAGGCNDLLMNILLQAKTIDNGQWIGQPGSKDWLKGQIVGIINRIGATVVQQGGSAQQAIQTLPLQQFATQSVLPSMGSQVASQVAPYIK